MYYFTLKSLYGYMDEHKKQMIQQWVEGQTQVHNTGNNTAAEDR